MILQHYQQALLDQFWDTLYIFPIASHNVTYLISIYHRKITPENKIFNYITIKSFINEKRSLNKEIEDAEYKQNMYKLYTTSQIS